MLRFISLVMNKITIDNLLNFFFFSLFKFLIFNKKIFNYYLFI